MSHKNMNGPSYCLKCQSLFRFIFTIFYFSCLAKMAAPTQEGVNMAWDLTIQLINKEFGEDVKSLVQAEDLLQQVSNTKKSLEQQVYIVDKCCSCFSCSSMQPWGYWVIVSAYSSWLNHSCLVRGSSATQLIHSVAEPGSIYGWFSPQIGTQSPTTVCDVGHSWATTLSTGQLDWLSVWETWDIPFTW